MNPQQLQPPQQLQQPQKQMMGTPINKINYNNVTNAKLIQESLKETEVVEAPPPPPQNQMYNQMHPQQLYNNLYKNTNNNAKIIKIAKYSFFIIIIMIFYNLPGIKSLFCKLLGENDLYINSLVGILIVVTNGLAIWFFD